MQPKKEVFNRINKDIRLIADSRINLFPVIIGYKQFTKLKKIKGLLFLL